MTTEKTKPKSVAGKVAAAVVVAAAAVGSYTPDVLPVEPITSEQQVFEAKLAATTGITIPENNTLITVRTQQEFFQACRAAETANITEIRIAAPIMYLDSGIRLPGKLFSQAKKLKISGAGVIAARKDTIKALLYRIPKDQTEALNVFQSQSITFDGLTLIGRTGKETGILYSAGYGGGALACNFENLGTGVDFQFVLMGFVKQCLFTNCKNYGIRFRNGQWTGAGLANAQSNSCRGEQDRVFNATGTTAAFSTEGASGVVWDQCISEGGNPLYHFNFDALGSPVVKDFTVLRAHIESPTQTGGSGIRIKAAGGYVLIDGVFCQYAMTLIDARGSSSYPHIFVERIPWILGGTQFAMDETNEIWTFHDIIGFNVTDAARWVNGVKPYYYSCLNYTQAPEWTYQGLKMNGKTPALQ